MACSMCRGTDVQHTCDAGECYWQHLQEQDEMSEHTPGPDMRPDRKAVLEDGDEVEYLNPVLPYPIKATFRQYVEGWVEIEFWDHSATDPSTAIVRPSRIRWQHLQEQEAADTIERLREKLGQQHEELTSLYAQIFELRNPTKPPMDIVERVARAIAALDGFDPDEQWEEWTRNIGEDGMLETYPRTRWKESEPRAHAILEAIRSAGYVVVPVEPTEAI